MTREEQIIEAGIEYTMQNDPVCIGGDKFYEMSKMLNRNKSFEEGAKWADNHPINVWHDVSEMPKENYKNIIYQTNYYSMFNVHIAFIPTCLRSCKITSRSWNEFVKEVNMKKWAYIDDLLPKGNNK